jgi:formate dehydrogenase subunit delta
MEPLMRVERLAEMANQVAAFFASHPGKDAAAATASHLRRFWEPQMKKQIVEHFESARGGGLSDVARAAVGILAEEAHEQAPARS